MSVTLDAGFLRACHARIASADLAVADGRVRAGVGLVIEADGLRPRMGALCQLTPEGGDPPFLAEVIGFREDRFLLMPLGEARGVGPGARVRLASSRASVVAGDACLGRVLDGLGRPLDGGPALVGEEAPLQRRPEPALTRQRVRRPLDVGVRALNAFTPLGRGARLGIFAGSGVGKSTLLGMIARGTDADVNVIALVGERGREVREFLERDLGPALERSVIVVATSDEAPLLRVRAAWAATAIAEHFRDRGRHVLLLMDSVTRFCTALREIGLAAGEPPTTRGYTPTVWSVLPRLLERAGTSAGAGTITALYAVLVEGDDHNEPVADAVRSILDGHIVLRRELADRGQYPPVDVLASVSRVMPDVVGRDHLALAQRARAVLACWRGAEDLVSVGAYTAGSDRAIDEARRLEPRLRAFLRQTIEERTSLGDSVKALGAAMQGAEVA